MKTCNKCGIEKPKSRFYKNKTTKDGLQHWCKICMGANNKEHRNTLGGKESYKRSRRKYLKTTKGKKTNKNNHLKCAYGITLKDYTQILEEQECVCAICGADDPGGGNNHFHVDHNHITGEIRGLLCINCNRGLGGFKDNIETILRAAQYLVQQKLIGGV